MIFGNLRPFGISASGTRMKTYGSEDVEKYSSKIEGYHLGEFVEVQCYRACSGTFKSADLLTVSEPSNNQGTTEHCAYLGLKIVHSPFVYAASGQLPCELKGF